MKMVDLRTEAIAEAHRLTGARALITAGDERAAARLEGDEAWVAFARRSGIRRALGRRICVVWRVAFDDASGRRVESRLVATLVDLPRSSGPRDIRSLIRELDDVLRARVDAACEQWASDAMCVADAFSDARLAREEAIARLAPSPRVATQPGLFDRRAERSRNAKAAAMADAEQTAFERVRGIASGAIGRQPPRMLLVLVPWRP